MQVDSTLQDEEMFEGSALILDLTKQKPEVLTKDGTAFYRHPKKQIRDESDENLDAEEKSNTKGDNDTKLLVKIPSKPFNQEKPLSSGKSFNHEQDITSGKSFNQEKDGMSGKSFNCGNDETLLDNENSTSVYDDSDLDVSEDDEGFDSSDTDNYVQADDTVSSANSKEFRESKDKQTGQVKNIENEMSQNSLDMYKEDIDLFAQKTVDKMMGEDLQNRIEQLVKADIWTCEICGKIFDEKLKHKYHMENHRKKKNHLCQVCGRGFLDSKRLLCHMSSHTGDKLFPCEICGKKLSQLSGMRRHMRGHLGEKPFDCGVCKKSFTTKGSLKVHMRLHTGEKPYKCNVCGNTFTARSTLWSHEKIHTGEKDLECKVCGKHFTLNSTLKKHLLIHDETYNEKFPCDICGKEYMARNSMQRHRKTHAMEDDKPFPCDICGNKYAMMSSLRRHKEIHFRGEMTKDFQCEYCPRSFAYKSSVVLHMKRNHKLKADGTPLDSDSTGMYIVPSDSVNESLANDQDTAGDSESEHIEETEENVSSLDDNSCHILNQDKQTKNSESEQFLYALDLVKREICKQFAMSDNLQANETQQTKILQHVENSNKNNMKKQSNSTTEGLSLTVRDCSLDSLMEGRLPSLTETKTDSSAKPRLDFATEGWLNAAAEARLNSLVKLGAKDNMMNLAIDYSLNPGPKDTLYSAEDLTLDESQDESDS